VEINKRIELRSGKPPFMAGGNGSISALELPSVARCELGAQLIGIL
jgi:hypothetical protein